MVLAPNTNLWETTDANNVSGGVSVRSLEADFYIEDDNLGGQTLTFAGYCPSNNIAGTCFCQAFVEDFNSSYTLVAFAVTNLAAGQSFSLTTPTTAGDHIQYGLRTDGPIESPDGTPDPWGGSAFTSAQVAVPLPPVIASRAGQVTSLGFQAENNHSYTVQYKTNLTDAAWLNLGPVITGNGIPASVTDTTGAAKRFYRLSIQ